MADDAEAPAAARPGIGETLRATRESRRASIEYVSELLRIEPQFLAALEEERFDAIGPPVFVKGYLKHYAELLGLDPRPLLDALRERLGREEPPLRARRPAESAKDRSRLAAAGIGAVVVVLVGATFWQLGPGVLGGFARDEAPERNGAAVERSEPTAAGVVEARAPAGTEPGAPADADPAAARGIESRAPAAGTERAATRVSEPGAATSVEPRSAAVAPRPGSTVELALELPPAEAGSSAASATGRVPPAATETLASGPVAQSAASQASAADAAAALAGAPRLDVELRFVEDSWTEVTSSSGERLYYGLARAGAEERIRADGEIRVLLGNADGVVVRVNGEPFAYPAGSRRGDLARFRLSPRED